MTLNTSSCVVSLIHLAINGFKQFKVDAKKRLVVSYFRLFSYTSESF